MPKNRKVVKHDGVSTVQNVPSKNHIGTRKSGKAASLMSRSELETHAEHKGKTGHKARMELQKRVSA